MFRKNRKEVVLSESTLVILRTAEEILGFVLRDEKCKFHHASLMFHDDTNLNQPDKSTLQDVTIHALIFVDNVCIDPRIRFDVEHINHRWKPRQDSLVLVTFFNDEPICFYFNEDGRLMSRRQEDVEKLNDLRQRLIV